MKFLTNETDFAFEGILPLVWSRSYYSDQDGTGWLGEGWSVPGCQRIIRDAAGLAYIDDQGRLFPLPEVDEDDEEPVLFESEQIWFSKNPDGQSGRIAMMRWQPGMLQPSPSQPVPSLVGIITAAPCLVIKYSISGAVFFYLRPSFLA